MIESRFVDDRHALYVGWVVGIAERNGIRATPVRDREDNYTDHILIRFSARITITVVVPPPPDDWLLEP